MNKIVKNILKYGGVLFLFGLIIFISNDLFIRDWRIKHSEERVKKNIKLNFQNKKEEFKMFNNFLLNLEMNPVDEIEFLGENKICGYLSGHSKTDSILDNSFYIHFSSDNESEVEFELRKNGSAKVNYLDTIFETYNWSWIFNGNNEDIGFKKFIKYIGITEEELNVLRCKTKALNCEAIGVHEDKSISIRFDGFSMYQYEYYFPNKRNEVNPKYEKLDEGIYSGLYDSGLFCGGIIFDK